jgi:hypothetical protein
VRVYNYMASGLALSGVVAFGLFSSAGLASLFFERVTQGVGEQAYSSGVPQPWQ